MYENVWNIIINPHAGSGKTMSEWNKAIPLLHELKLDYVSSMTTHKTHATQLAYDAAEAGYRRILAVGGDGTIHEVSNGVLAWCEDHGCDPTEFVLGLAPIGSGNDWIKTLGIPLDVPSVLHLIAKESFGFQDVIKVTTSGGRTCYMTNVGGICLDSHICQRVNTKKEAGQRSKLIYVGGLLYTLFNYHPDSFQIIMDGREVYSGRCHSVAIGNGKYSGGGMCQVPDAVIDDGLLDVTVYPGITLARLAIDAPRLFGHSLKKARPLKFFKCKTIDIIPLDSESADIIEVDGEIEGMAPLRVAVTGQRIGVIRVK